MFKAYIWDHSLKKTRVVDNIVTMSSDGRDVIFTCIKDSKECRAVARCYDHISITPIINDNVYVFDDGEWVILKEVKLDDNGDNRSL